MEKIDSLKYGLSKRVKLVFIDDKSIGIEKIIKSRIIKKDASKIIEISKQIKSVNQSINIKLICTENICSKSKLLLTENGIEIIYI